MGQVPAKTFPQPVAFGDSQINTLRQSQAPDLIQQQQLPSLNFLNTGANVGPAVQQSAPKLPTNPVKSLPIPGFRGPYPYSSR